MRCTNTRPYKRNKKKKCTCEIYNLRLNMCLEAMPKLHFSPLVRWWKFLGLGKPHVYYCSKLHSRDNLVNDNHFLHLLCATQMRFLLLMHCYFLQKYRFDFVYNDVIDKMHIFVIISIYIHRKFRYIMSFKFRNLNIIEKYNGSSCRLKYIWPLDK